MPQQYSFLHRCPAVSRDCGERGAAPWVPDPVDGGAGRAAGLSVYHPGARPSAWTGRKRWTGRMEDRAGTEASSLVELMRMARQECDLWTRGSAIRRAGCAGLERNAAVTMENLLASVERPRGDGRRCSGRPWRTRSRCYGIVWPRRWNKARPGANSRPRIAGRSVGPRLGGGRLRVARAARRAFELSAPPGMCPVRRCSLCGAGACPCPLCLGSRAARCLRPAAAGTRALPAKPMIILVLAASKETAEHRGSKRHDSHGVRIHRRWRPE